MPLFGRSLRTPRLDLAKLVESTDFKLAVAREVEKGVGTALGDGVLDAAGEAVSTLRAEMSTTVLSALERDRTSPAFKDTVRAVVNAMVDDGVVATTDATRTAINAAVAEIDPTGDSFREVMSSIAKAKINAALDGDDLRDRIGGILPQLGISSSQVKDRIAEAEERAATRAAEAARTISRESAREELAGFGIEKPISELVEPIVVRLLEAAVTPPGLDVLFEGGTDENTRLKAFVAANAGTHGGDESAIEALLQPLRAAAVGRDGLVSSLALKNDELLEGLAEARAEADQAKVAATGAANQVSALDVAIRKNAHRIAADREAVVGKLEALNGSQGELHARLTDLEGAAADLGPLRGLIEDLQAGFKALGDQHELTLARLEIAETEAAEATKAAANLDLANKALKDGLVDANKKIRGLNTRNETDRKALDRLRGDLRRIGTHVDFTFEAPE